MKQAASAPKRLQTNVYRSNLDASVRPDGLAIAPPSYGIGVLDAQSAEAASKPSQEYLVPAPDRAIQMQAAAGSLARTRPPTEPDCRKICELGSKCFLACQ